MEIIPELPLLRVSLEAAAPLSSSVAELLRRRSHAASPAAAAAAAGSVPRAAGATQQQQQHQLQQQQQEREHQVLVHAPAAGEGAPQETEEPRRRGTLWSDARSDSDLAVPCTRLGPPSFGGPPGDPSRWRRNSGREGPPLPELPALSEEGIDEDTGDDGDQEEAEQETEEDEPEMQGADGLLAAFSFDAREHPPQGINDVRGGAAAPAAAVGAAVCRVRVSLFVSSRCLLLCCPI